MLSDADAAVVGALIGSVSGLAGLWLGYYLSRSATEADRRTEKLLTLYRETEHLWNLLAAVQKQKMDRTQFYRQWVLTTENIMGALFNSGLDQKRILKAINGKWDDPKSVMTLQALADELHEKLDPDNARAGREMLSELGVSPEDIEPIVLPADSRQDGVL